jgi:hypothetical protein
VVAISTSITGMGLHKTFQFIAEMKSLNEATIYSIAEPTELSTGYFYNGIKGRAYAFSYSSFVLPGTVQEQMGTAIFTLAISNVAPFD